MVLVKKSEVEMERAGHWAGSGTAGEARQSHTQFASLNASSSGLSETQKQEGEEKRCCEVCKLITSFIQIINANWKLKIPPRHSILAMN